MEAALLLALVFIFGACSSGSARADQEDPPTVDQTDQEVIYYVGPNGDDSNSGTTPERSMATFQAAVSKLKPGNTLIILDGTYLTKEGNKFYADCSDNAQNGTVDNPITVRAENERHAWIKGNGAVTPFRLNNCSYWDVSGLRVSSDDYKNGGAHIFQIRKSDHIRLRRLLLYHNNRWKNSDALSILLSHHILVEETEMYYFHRHAIGAYKSDHLILRRNFANARNATDLPDNDAWSSHGCCTKGGDGGYSLYFTSNSIVENSISVQTEGISIIGGVSTVLGNPAGQNNKLLGNISYKDLRPLGSIQSRRFDDPDRPYTGPAKNNIIKNSLVVGGQEIDKGAPFTPTVGKNMKITGATWYHSKQTAIYADPSTRDLGDRAFLGCEPIGGCDYQISNVLMLDNSAENLIYAPPKDQLHFQMSYSNSWPQKLGTEPLGDTKGQFRNSMHKEPTNIGLEQGQCMVFVPKASNMSKAGKDGSDIGANILYRYKDGILTDKPLWDPQTGAFPHGAVIKGSANDPANHKITAASINKLLNVNANGCQLPYR